MVGSCKDPKVLIVIPAYNEEDSLEHTLTELFAYLDGASFSGDYLVVNDGSNDETHAVCERNGYTCLNLPINTGLSSGFQAGMKYAYRHGYDYVIQFDADGQHDPKYLACIIEAGISRNADIVIGSRFVAQKKHFSMRMIGSSFITAMIKITAGVKITDPTSGMRMFDKKFIERFAKDNNYAPEPDTIAFAVRNGANVVEVPVEMRERFGGKSYLTAAKSIIYMVRMGLSILCFQWIRRV